MWRCEIRRKLPKRHVLCFFLPAQVSWPAERLLRSFFFREPVAILYIFSICARLERRIRILKGRSATSKYYLIKQDFRILSCSLVCCIFVHAQVSVLPVFSSFSRKKGQGCSHEILLFSVHSLLLPRILAWRTLVFLFAFFCSIEPIV